MIGSAARHATAAWLVLMTFLPHACGENWPEFRGPSGDGHAHTGTLPVSWSEKDHIAWKVPIHGRGWCSPVVWGPHVWLTTATEDGRDMSVLCIDRESGEVVHDIQLFHNEEPRFCHATNSYASPSPVVEAARVYVHFGSYGTACLDSATGEQVWSRRDFPCNHWRGPGSSPILFDGMLIVHFDGYDHQYVVALDKQTGETIWRTERDIDYGTDDGDLMKAYATPTVIDVAGQKQLISPAAKATIAYDPHTGRELWRIRYDQHSAATRPIWRDNLIFINTGFPRAQLLAVRMGGEGDITDTHVEWIVKRSVPSMPSQLVIDDLLYMVHDGVVTCLEAESGAVVWQQRVAGKYSASPIYGDGKVYVCNQAGTTTVFRPGREYVELASNRLDDGFMASPAVAGNTLILRTRTHLYCVK